MSHSHHDSPLESIRPEDTPKPFPRTLLFGAGLTAIIALVVGTLPKIAKAEEARRFMEKTAVPTVNVIRVTPPAESRDILLPGAVRALNEAPIHARTGGYLKKLHVEIGSKVKAGDVLAELDAPELDAQLTHARAALARAVADRKLADDTARRMESLRDSKAISAKELDEIRAEALAKAAVEAGARAEEERLARLVSFRTLVAPFDGVITQRNTDLGDLITPGGANAKPLFRIGAMNTLRVFVNVPEADAGAVVPGSEAVVMFTATPGLEARGKVVRTAGAIDDSSRTLLVEIHLDNADGKFAAGSYSRVKLRVNGAAGSPTLPVNTLLMRPEGTLVGVVNAEGRVVLRKVETGRNLGNRIEIRRGLSPEDKVIVNPSDSLVDGSRVNVRDAAPKA